MKKFLPYIIITAIIIILVVLSLPKDQKSGGTGIVKENQESRIKNQEEPSQPELVSGSSGDETTKQVRDDNNVEVGISVGNRASNFKLETFDGKVVELASISQPVVIDFWAAWCPFCVAELPELEAVHQEFGDKVQFLGIHRSETESIEKGQEFADDKGVTYPLLKDSTGDVYDVYSGGQPFMPVAYFIDADGIIQERVLGPKSKDKIRSSVNKLLK